MAMIMTYDRSSPLTGFQATEVTIETMAVPLCFCRSMSPRGTVKGFNYSAITFVNILVFFIVIDKKQNTQANLSRRSGLFKRCIDN